MAQFVDKFSQQTNVMDIVDFDEDKTSENNTEKELECHARIISFFAHKGGVSKTTNVYHLAYILAKKFNFKVLMIDADPQTNLTQTCCRTAKTDANWRDSVERGTIFTAVERLHYGMKDGEYIDPANCVELYTDRIINGGKLYLLPGSLDLAKLEPQITFAHNITNPSVFPLFDDIVGGFRHLFISTCAHYDIDFCLIDMGPSIGELNKSLFWSSDYFLIPCSADSYCKTTIKTMQKTLPNWAIQQKQLNIITSDMTLPINPNLPKFLGILMSLFNVSGKNKKPIKDSQHWIDIIKQTVKSEFVKELENINMIHSYSPNDFTLAEIPNFLSLMPIAQRSHCTVFDIPINGYFIQTQDGDIKQMSKTEISRHQQRSKYFEIKYTKLAETLLNMFNAEDSVENSLEIDII